MNSTTNTQDLHVINMMLKCACPCSHDGFQRLTEYDLSLTPLTDALQILYLKAKYFKKQYLSSKNIDEIKEAEDCLDELFDLAYQEEVRVANPKYWFARAFAKYERAKCESGEVREKLLWKAENIIYRAHNKWKHNKSISWLFEEIKKSRGLI